ncbi:MAG: hypothetical protein LBB38_01360 [Puniceicoccales bacterium]|jgi:hypothetical protein|nr:hypothetical protein [Puniceicoccales bacterium]
MNSLISALGTRSSSQTDAANGEKQSPTAPKALTCIRNWITSLMVFAAAATFFVAALMCNVSWLFIPSAVLYIWLLIAVALSYVADKRKSAAEKSQQAKTN